MAQFLPMRKAKTADQIGEIRVADSRIFQMIGERQQGRQPHRLIHGENGVRRRSEITSSLSPSRPQ